MKALVIASMLLGSVAFANEGAAPAAAPAAAPVAHEAKMTRKEAKAACKAEGRKGKGMRACLKEKMGH